MIASNIRVPGSYNEIDASGANKSLPSYRQPMAIVAPGLAAPSAWASQHAYVLGDTVHPVTANGHYYICIVAGTSSSQEPTWPGSGGNVTDGTCKWRELATVSEFIAVHTPVRVYSADEVARYAGAGSLAHRMAIQAFRQYRYVELTIDLVDDANGGVKAAGSIAVSGTATAPGVIDIDIGIDRISYSYATGDAAAAIAAGIDAAIAANHDLAITSDVSTSTVNLRAKNAGTPGNVLGKWSVSNSKYEPVVTKTVSDGITVTVTGFSGGATDPDLTNALDALTQDYFGIVVTPYTGAAQIADLKEYIAEVSNEINCRGVRSWIATTKSIADATTLADANYERLHCVLVRKVKMPSYEIAAAAAADHAATGHPAIPLNNRSLIACDTPDIGDRLDFSEINSLLWNGVTPYNADTTGVVRCVRSITTYTNNAAGSPDDLYLDTTTIANLDYARRAIKSRDERDFSDKVLRDNHVEGEPEFIVTPDDIKSAHIDVALRLEEFGVLQNVKSLIAQFVSTRDANVQGRVNSIIPAEVVQGLHVLANTLSITTSV